MSRHLSGRAFEVRGRGHGEFSRQKEVDVQNTACWEDTRPGLALFPWCLLRLSSSPTLSYLILPGDQEKGSVIPILHKSSKVSYLWHGGEEDLSICLTPKACPEHLLCGTEQVGATWEERVGRETPRDPRGLRCWGGLSRQVTGNTGRFSAGG